MANFLTSPQKLAHSLTVTILLISFHSSYGYYYLEEKSCGVLFSDANYGGLQYQMNDRDQSIYLKEDLRAAEDGWNVTGSLQIESGCTMQICNETYFDGSCQTVLSGNYSVTTTLNLTNIESVMCSCPKECKCSDIFMKKSTCARAYLKGGCRNCNAPYVDLEGSKPFFPEEFAEDLTSLRIRKGCTLTVYPEEDFEGEEEIIDSEVIEKYKGTIGSYECTCDPKVFYPRQRPPRPASYPPNINIPTTLDEVIRALSNKTTSEHPGLKAALKSARNKRSTKNAYILLLGATGAGKSSAINLLFDNPNVTKVGEEKSTTTNIHEFRIPVPIDEIGVANSELRVIDTPGLGDTRGLEQDAKFLATLDSFLTNHEELKDKIPNIVLIFHKFHDNRFNGEGSQFVKMLRGLDSFRERITDENYSNIIFVLSHFCSETKINQRRPERRLSQFKNVINDFTQFPKPTLITVAENKAKDQELPMVNGYFKLPNNEYYPRNLFEKMELVTENGGDMIGLGVFRSAFRDSDDFNVTSRTFELLPREGNRVEHYLRILSNAMIGVEKTEISQILQQAWDDKVDVNLRKKFPFSLHYLQKALNIRNVNFMEDVPKTSAAILELLTAIKHDEATRTLLEKALKIRPPTFPQNTVAGYSYNVFKDTYLPTSPFVMGDVQQSEIGYMIPKILTCKLEVGTKENFQIFQTTDEYLQHRIKSLGIDGAFAKESFTGQIKPGHNIKEISFKNDSCTLSATREFRLFEFILNDRLALSPEFTAAVKSLAPFNQTDHGNVEKWKQFFNDFGTHVVKSIYGGGAIEIELQSNKPFNNDLAQALFDLIKFAEEMTFIIDDEDGSSNRTVLKDGIAHTLTFIGGDSAYHTSDLTKMTVEKASKLLTDWKKSLKLSPAVLNTQMQLEPLGRIVKKLGQNYSAEIEKATSLLFKADLKYVHVKPSDKQGPQPARDQTPFMNELLKMQQQSNQKIQEMMMEMKRVELVNQQRQQEMEEKRLQWDRERQQAEMDWRREQAEANRKAESEKQQWLATLEQQRQRQNAERREREEQHQRELMKAQEEARRRSDQLMQEIMNRPPPETSSCLKPGTKILMSDLTEKNVENLLVGDMVMDKDLKPTKILGVSYEFLLNQKLYGFGKNPAFFTNSHLFVGPGITGQLRLYAKSVSNLYQHNPLLEYLNVTEMGTSETKTVTLYHFEDGAVVAKPTTVFQDQQLHAMDSLVYFLQVDSPTGTYFANGYVCQHEIPPVEYWPNTMSLLFRLMKTTAFEKLAEMEYSLGTIMVVDDSTNFVESSVKKYVHNDMENDIESSNASNYLLMTLQDINMEESISKIFNNPTVAAAAVSLYAKTSVILSPYLDGANALPGHTVAALQHKLFTLIEKELNFRFSDSMSALFIRSTN